MNIPEMLISALLKKGILYEAENSDIEFELPITQKTAEGGTEKSKVTIHFKAEKMKLRIERKNEDES